MKQLEALNAVYDRLQDRIVVTIMGAVAAELQSIGHRPNFFYLQHAMGLASSMGLGIALAKSAFDQALAAGDLTTIVAKVEAVGPSGYVTDLSLLENRFQFARSLRS
jgi:hypothetical protein